MSQTLKKIGDLCDLQNGFAFKSKDYVEHSNTLNIRMSNIRPNGVFDEEHNLKYLPDSYSEKYRQFLLKDGDLIVAMTDMAGEPKILGLPTLVKNTGNRKFLLNQRVGKLYNFSDDIYVPYLRYYMTSLKDYYKNKGAGGLQINISKKDILSAPIYLPLLAEQQRIVAKLDTTFAEIDRVVELTSSRKFQSEQLLKKMLSKEFCKSPNRQSMTFADVCTLQRGFDLPKSKRRAGRYPLYSANGITDYIDVAKTNAPGVITGRSGTIGAVHYIEKEFWPLNTSLYVKDFKGNLPKYVFYFLKSFNLKKYASGTGVPTLNRNVLSDKIVWISGKQNEQQETCEKLDEATEQVTSLNQILNKQLANYQALKLTILAQELQSEAA